MAIDPTLLKGLSRKSLRANAKGPNITLPTPTPSKPVTPIDFQGKTQSVLLYPPDLITAQHFFIMIVMDYKRESWKKIGQTTPEYILGLPLPSPLIDKQDVALDKVALGALGYAALEGGAAYSNLALDPKAFSASLANFAKNSGVAALAGAFQAADAVTKRLTGAELIKPGLAGAGLALNEFLTIMLKGPMYKNHELTWRFSPNNALESKILQFIMAIIKNAQAPSIQTGGLFFKYPKVFQCFIHTTSITNDYEGMVYGFKPCLLESAVFNYTPANVPSFYSVSAQPEGVQMQLRFQELEFWLNEQGYDAYKGMPDNTDVPRGGL